jgi:hypothetical protein
MFLNYLVNGYDIGGRSLRVDRADQEMGSAPSNSNGINNPTQTNQSQPSRPHMTPLPMTGSLSMDSINAVLNGMSNQQLLEVVTQLKVFLKYVNNNNPS